MVLSRFLYNFGKFAFFDTAQPGCGKKPAASPQKRKSAIDHNGVSLISGTPAGTRILDPLIKSNVIALLCVPLYRQILALTAFYYVHILQVLRKTSAFADHVMGFDVQKTCKNVHLLTKITQDSSMY